MIETIDVAAPRAGAEGACGMYIPKHFEQTDEGALFDLIDEHAFGTLITAVDGRPFASHLPFLADRDARVLHCHVARANPHWQQLAASPAVLAIFAGPHGYISPTWYTSPGVPTWNYAVVHVYGEARSIDDPAHARRHVEALAAKFERGRGGRAHGERQRQRRSARAPNDSRRDRSTAELGDSR